MHTSQLALSLVKKPIVWLTPLLIFSGLFGCSNKPEDAAKQEQEAKTEKFASAINSYLSKKNNLCLGLHHWPVKVSETDLQLADVFPEGIAGQMAALERAGIVSASEEQTRALASSDPDQGFGNIKAKKYQLTDLGKKFAVETEIDSTSFEDNKKLIKSDICYGKKILDQVVKQKPPIGSGSSQDDEQQTVVRYMYKIDNLADWVKNPDIKTAFPSIEQRFKESSHTYKIALKLTSSGWVPIE